MLKRSSLVLSLALGLAACGGKKDEGGGTGGTGSAGSGGGTGTGAAPSKPPTQAPSRGPEHAVYSLGSPPVRFDDGGFTDLSVQPLADGEARLDVKVVAHCDLRSAA